MSVPRNRQTCWQVGCFLKGIYPLALAYGHFDLLNYALPLELARRLDVFGPDEEHIPHADWLAFERSFCFLFSAAPATCDPSQHDD
jgi:hypothetical protein